MGERFQICPEIRIGEILFIDCEIPFLSGKNMYRLRLFHRFRRFGLIRQYLLGKLGRGRLFLRGLRRRRLRIVEVRFHPVDRHRRQLNVGLLRQSRARSQREQRCRKQQTARSLDYDSFHIPSPQSRTRSARRNISQIL